MKLYIGVTDNDWFRFLRAREPAPTEANFWQPSGSRDFRALQPGEPFLFKLHSPENYIAGGGFFACRRDGAANNDGSNYPDSVFHRRGDSFVICTISYRISWS